MDEDIICGGKASASSSSLHAQLAISWDFDTLQLDQQALEQVAFNLLVDSFVQSGGTRTHVLRAFIKKVQSEYQLNPFHGFHRAVDVAQAVLRLGLLIPWHSLLSRVQQFALLVAAIGFNVAHPGVKSVLSANAGDVELLTPLHNNGNGAASLERTRCRKLLEILESGGCDVLGHLTDHEASIARDLIRDAILHTATAYHSTVVLWLHDLYAEHMDAFGGNVLSVNGPGTMAGQSKEQFAAFGDRETIAAVCRALFLTATLAFASRPWKIAWAWAQRLRMELLGVGDDCREQVGAKNNAPTGFMPATYSLHHEQRQQRQQGAVAASLSAHHVYMAMAGLGLTSANVGPLLAAEIRIFGTWCELAEGLVANAQELSMLQAAIDGTGGSGKSLSAPAASEVVDLNRFTGLDEADTFCVARSLWAAFVNNSLGQVSATTKAAKLALMSSVAAPGISEEEPCSEPSCASQPSQRLDLKQQKDYPMVRELRRWQQNSEAGPRRELVLLYQVSEDKRFYTRDSPGPQGQGRGRPVSFSYSLPPPAADVGGVAQQSGPGTTTADDNICWSQPEPALPTMDSQCTRLATHRFNDVLSELVLPANHVGQPVRRDRQQRESEPAAQSKPRKRSWNKLSAFSRP